MFQDPKSFSAGKPVGRDAVAPRPVPAAPARIQPRAVPPAAERKPAPAAAPFSDRTQALLSHLSPERLQALAARLRPPQPEPPQPEPPQPKLDTRQWGFLWRRRSLIATCIAASLALCFLFSLMASHRYRAVAQLLISPIDLRVLDKALQQATQTADANVIQVESEARVLTSDKVLRRVVDAEKLAADPEFGGGGSFFSGVIPAIRAAIGIGSQSAHSDNDTLAALRALQRNVVARRTERTYVVDLIVDTGDPQKSARIANAVAQAYLDEQSASRTDTARRVTESLSSRLTELKERVRHAEEMVERYKSENNIVGANGRLVSEQQLTELNNQLTAAKARTAEAKSRYERTLHRNGADSGSTSEAVQSNTVGRLREQYAAVARQEATLSAELGPRHPWVIEARAQVRNVQRLITEEVGRVSDANRIDYERALANETSLSGSFETLKQRSVDTSMAFVKLRELEREVEASRAVYESFLVRARETREQERLDSANVRILSDAQPPRDRFWPPRLMILLLAGLAIGSLGGAGLAFMAERVSQTPNLVETTAVPKQGVR